MDKRLFAVPMWSMFDATDKYCTYLNELYGREFVGESKWIVDLLTKEGFIHQKERVVQSKAYLDLDAIAAQEKKSKAFKDEIMNLKPVMRKDWMPESVIYHTTEFRDWILSINEDFRSRTIYEPFEKYKQQVDYWISLKEQYSNYSHRDEQSDFLRTEMDRFRQNTLYLGNKYWSYKDKDSDTGLIAYQASEANKILLYLLDCGYCPLITKARQVFFTTSAMIYIANKSMYNFSHFSKIISEDEDTIKETIDDKFKDPIYGMPDYMRITSYRNSDQKMSWHGGWEDKGRTSKVQVGNVKETSVTGGSPDIIAIDEGAFIRTFQSIVRQAEPTLRGYDPNTKKQILKRQMIAWTTGGNPNAKTKNAAIGAAFESEFLSAMKLFTKKDDGQFWLPLFFNVWARQSYTQEDYNRDYKIAYAKEGEGQEEARRIFHQSNPVTVDDVFMRSAETLIPLKDINDHIFRINQKTEPVYGRFEPVYDYSKPFTEYNTNTPYYIVDAVFVPTSGPDDRKTTACLIDMPQRGWTNRYYQGTDPIKGASGHSKMSSVIWDAFEKRDDSGKIIHSRRPVCLLNMERGTNHQEALLQTMLMGIFYNKRIMNLVESNDGQLYFDYVGARNYDYTLAENLVLPDSLQTYGHMIGINKRAWVADNILDQMEGMIKKYGDSIDFIDFYIQLKTFIRVDSTTSEKVSYKPKNKRFDFDDVIDAMVYGYILMNSFSDMLPVNSEEKKKEKLALKLRRRGGFFIGTPQQLLGGR